MTTSTSQKWFLAATVVFFSLAVLSIASVSKHGIWPALLGLTFMLVAAFFLYGGTRRPGREHVSPWTGHGFTRLYIKTLGVFYLVTIFVALVAEGSAIQLRSMLFIAVYGALAIAAWGSIYFLVIALPGWAICRAVRYFVRKWSAAATESCKTE